MSGARKAGAGVRRRVPARAAALVCALIAAGAPAKAQQPGGLALEAVVGHAEFVDNASIPHTMFGVAARWYITPKLSIGPDVVYMRGPRSDRDTFFVGTATYDVLGPVAGSRPRVVPYLVGGGGFFQHRDRIGAATFTSSEGTFVAGGGARLRLSRSAYLAGELRVGWELHLQYAARVGVRLGSR